MKVTELGDYTVVIEKEDNDSKEFKMGNMFEDTESPKVAIFSLMEGHEVYKAKEYIVNDEVLIVYLDTIPKEIEVGSHVGVKEGNSFYQTVGNRTVDLCHLW
jgi:hypothetical protein